MNLTNAESIRINSKTVESISINGREVYTSGPIIRLTASKSFILTDETVTINLSCEDLPNTDIDLYSVINMTRTKLDTLTTDENGQASYTYTGTGAGEIGFVAVYDEKESNTVTVDDYTPAADNIALIADSYSVNYGASVTLTATVKDQHNQALSGATVTFKEGSTSLGTGTTNSSGVATLTKSDLNAGTHSITAEAGNVSSSAISVNVNKLNTATTIVPPTLVYSDEFDVSGTLKDANNTGIVGATVTLAWNDGTDHTATTTTTTGGAYTFHRDAPTAIRDYTFKVTYAGGTNYNGSETATETVTVGKETSVLTINSPSSPATVTGDSFNITGVLTDDDGTPIKGKWVDARIAGTATILGQVTTSLTDGSFTIAASTSQLSDGQNSVQVAFTTESSSTYTSAFASLTVVKTSFDGISLTSDKSILSYADNESATLSAQLTLSGSAVSISGESVTFEVRKQSDDSLVETLSGSTNSSGIASVSYLGKDAGTIYIQAISGSTQSTSINIEDIYKFDDLTSNNNLFTTSGGINATYNSNGLTVTGNRASDSYYLLNITLPTNYEIEWEIVAFGSESAKTSPYVRGIFIEYYSSSHKYGTYSSAWITQLNGDINIGDILKAKVENGAVSWYLNGNQIGSSATSVINANVGFKTYNNRSTTFKNMKIKSL